MKIKSSKFVRKLSLLNLQIPKTHRIKVNLRTNPLKEFNRFHPPLIDPKPSKNFKISQKTWKIETLEVTRKNPERKSPKSKKKEV